MPCSHDFIHVIFIRLFKGYPIPTRKSPLVLPEIRMLERVMTVRPAILPVKELTGGNDRLSAGRGKTYNLSSMIF